ncbi:hypothetical protein [uncultured Methanospirillum sp.]|uniref:hypothetical protein n=1 Tax=uncultured Methanospirillum sp. TaxID=262503 RepID=UPI0029C63409|nr:hypothetical protein [uncultured Methanospirillum sp.]
MPGITIIRSGRTVEISRAKQGSIWQGNNLERYFLLMIYPVEEMLLETAEVIPL